MAMRLNNESKRLKVIGFLLLVLLSPICAFTFAPNRRHPLQLEWQQQTTTTLHLQWEDVIFNVEAAASSLASTSLDNVSFSSLPIMYIAGLLTGVSPCVWGLLPLTMSYITTAAGERNDGKVWIPTLVFATGLASVFMTFGIVAATAGTLLGPSNQLAIVSNIICLAMGFQLLELIQLPLLSLNTVLAKKSTDVTLLDASGNILSNQPAPSGSLLRTFFLGASSALVASPCSTPVLTSMLAFCAKTHHPEVGAGLLGMYSLGYSTPLLVVAATGGQLLTKGNAQPWVTQMTGAVLVWIGTKGVLTAVLGDASLAGLAILE